jgi:predicted HicB family RNase H-like nuclease
MTAPVGQIEMAKKKSETRKHTAMMRIDADTLERVKLAASLMRTSLADYASDVLRKTADRDILREAKKLTEGKEMKEK